MRSGSAPNRNILQQYNENPRQCLQITSLGRRLRKAAICFLFLLTWHLLLQGSITSLPSTFFRSVGRKGKMQCGLNDFQCLADQSFMAFNRLQASQSTTVYQAQKKYMERYQRPPPKGFEAWAQFALDHSAPLLDEYGQIEADLAPYRNMKKNYTHWKQLMESAYKSNANWTESRRLGFLEIKDGVLSVEGYSFNELSNMTLSEMILPVVEYVPDLRILVNWFPQPRVLGEEKMDTETTGIIKNSMVDDRSGQDNWQLLRSPCPNTYVSSSLVARHRQDLDICKHDAIEKQNHGMFVAPPYFYPLKELVPILSRGKLSSMRDILFPNPCYWSDRYRLWSKADNMTFEEKKRGIYWRGQTTGVILSPATLYSSHRMRFVALLNALQTSSRLAIKRKVLTDNKHEDLDASEDALQKEWMKAQEVATKANLTLKAEDLDALSNLPPSAFDVAFHKVYKAESWSTKRLVQEVYPFKRAERAEDMYGHQFVADIDGESMSCRFYAQLTSMSVPLKQTLFAEWHDDRIMPWMHYIPVSTDYNALPALLAWLNTPEGQVQAARIAYEGHRWAARSLRKIDLTIYIYRLLLEIADVFGN